ncbi:hypothetical protein HHK36_030491 [Tetracentron sinense]|uniref:Uncharacterized protein n=1 Tax=Tetracentron sinense TaxID=13715 RepID=A0A834Y9G5_TETSI|nr:hypothetical protein HHK36_030491 [Tetracentron sinense]
MYVDCSRGGMGGREATVIEVEVASPQAMELGLKILYISLCHTDVFFWEAKFYTETKLASLVMKQEEKSTLLSIHMVSALLGKKEEKAHSALGILTTVEFIRVFLLGDEVAKGSTLPLSSAFSTLPAVEGTPKEVIHWPLQSHLGMNSNDCTSKSYLNF